MTRTQHIQWCKDRAIEYVNEGNLQDAYTSMASDLGKHPETEGHSAIQIGMIMLMTGQLSTTSKMKKFILGFN